MRPSEALEKNREAIRGVVARYRVANPRVFGSAARRKDDEESDLDILVDTLPGATLLDFGGLQFELEKLLGVRVDVVNSSGLAKRFRARILSEARPI
jgi:predicted nucleotidyltransferase